MQTYRGHMVNLINPDPTTLFMEDIAMGLAKQCRFNGQLQRYYSVAEHSMLAANLAHLDGVRLSELKAIFMHDAHEAYTGEIITPMKHALMGLKSIIERLDTAIGDRFGIDFVKHHDIIKHYDLLMLKAEKKTLLRVTELKWDMIDEVDECSPLFKFYDHPDSYVQFLKHAKAFNIREVTHDNKSK